jgi:hypothetical protein
LDSMFDSTLNRMLTYTLNYTFSWHIVLDDTLDCTVDDELYCIDMTGALQWRYWRRAVLKKSRAEEAPR